METEIMNTRNNLGGSIPVANVQELASSNLNDIPHRYIQPEIKPDEVSIDQSSQIPVIDMSMLVAGNSGYRTEMENLHQACKQWGFFQLINHGATTAIEKMKAVVKEFFNLPLQQKMAYAQVPNCPEGYGQAFVVSEYQKLEWADMLLLLPLPLSGRNMRFWPNVPTSFRSTLDEYSLELCKVNMSLYKLMAANLGVEFEKLSCMYEDCTQGIRMNYYPPCLQANKVIGLAPHSDAGGLTLLVQIDEVDGLQIKNNGKWVPVIPNPGAIIVNIGDALEIMTNGEYSSIEHRAVVNFKKERLSIAAFHGPNLKTELGPLPDLVKENGANYNTVKHEDYMKLYFSSKLSGKRMLDHLRIKH